MMIKHKRKLLFLAGAIVLLVGLLAVVAAPRAAAEPQAVGITWDGVAAGGQTMSSASYTIVATAGQPAAAQSTSSSYDLLSGYWGGIVTLLEQLGGIFLPIVRSP
jgi:hypothetical protein